MGRSLWTMLFVMLLAQGCSTIDDNEDCFALARLRLQWTRNTSSMDLVHDNVESADLYVYKTSDSSLVATKRFTKNELASYNYSIPLDWLRMGDYRVLVFGNYNEDSYERVEHENTRTLRMRMKSDDETGRLTRNPGHFFYGSISLLRFDHDTKIVELTKNTNNINIHIENDDPATRADADGEGLPDLEVTIVAKNGTIKYDNTIDGDDTRLMTHISQNEFPQYEQNLNTTLTVGRLFTEDGSRLVITRKDTNEVIHDGPLSDRIAELLDESPRWEGTNPDFYLDIQDEHDMYYTVEMKNGVLIVTDITVEMWNTINNPVGGV